MFILVTENCNLLQELGTPYVDLVEHAGLYFCKVSNEKCAAGSYIEYTGYTLVLSVGYTYSVNCEENRRDEPETLRIVVRSIKRNDSVSTRTVFDTSYLLTVHTVRRGFDGPSCFQPCRTYLLRLGMALNIFYIMKLGFIALLLYDEEQFLRERVSTKRRMSVHFCLRNRKNGRGILDII
jgi:hypothetical protein